MLRQATRANCSLTLPSSGWALILGHRAPPIPKPPGLDCYALGKSVSRDVSSTRIGIPANNKKNPAPMRGDAGLLVAGMKCPLLFRPNSSCQRPVVIPEYAVQPVFRPVPTQRRIFSRDSQSRSGWCDAHQLEGECGRGLHYERRVRKTNRQICASCS